MIEVKFKKTRELLRLTVKGHADYAKEGEDIICASATILAYTLAQLVSNAYKGDALKDAPTLRLEKGDIKIECHPKDDETRQIVKNIYMFTQTGYQLLANGYPEYITIESFVV